MNDLTLLKRINNIAKEINIKNIERTSLFKPKGEDFEVTNIFVKYPEINKKIEVAINSTIFFIKVLETSFLKLGTALKPSSP